MVALKLEDGRDHLSPDNYKVDDLVTYADARNLTNRKPYIATVIASSGFDGNIFVLGDGRNTNHPTTQKRRSATIGYFNGLLEPGVSYSIFQRIIINDEVGIGDYKSAVKHTDVNAVANFFNPDAAKVPAFIDDQRNMD